jgi:hypothetical protein
LWRILTFESSQGLYTQLGHCLVALFRLSTFESPDIPWDRQRIISELDLGEVIHKWVHVFDSSPEAAGIDGSNALGQESQWEYSKKLLFTTILKWWESKVRPSIMNHEQPPNAESEQQQPAAGDLDTSLPGIDFGDIDFDFDSELWMRDMLSSGFDFRSF